MREAEQGRWKQFFLSENFRSEERILQFINQIFRAIMPEALGGIAYDQNAELQFGRKSSEDAGALPSSVFPEVEVVLISDGGGDADSPQEEDETTGEAAEGADAEEMEKAEREAIWIARELKKLHRRADIARDEKGKFRELKWSDMVIILRSVKNHVETYARVFECEGVPLQLKNNSFYSSIETLDLLNLLSVLDNPLQDIPLLALLRSPMGGFSANELARIRLSLRRGHFWDALRLCAKQLAAEPLGQKCAEMVATIQGWRELGKNLSISGRLETILQETLYAEWAATQLRGRQRQANISQFITLAREFDHLNGEGLYLFLRHIQQEREASEQADSAAVESSDAVRLMSAHQSKGLEFPVVAVPDISKQFNFKDLRSGLILDEDFGLCSRIKAQTTGALYPSLPLWLARRRGETEILAEELRILYVALTRAQSKLILVASASEKNLQKRCKNTETGITLRQLLNARSWFDWIQPALSQDKPEWLEKSCSSSAWSSRLVAASSVKKGEEAGIEPPRPILDDLAINAMRAKFAFRYPHLAATRQHAKATVTQLRRGLEIFSSEEARPALFAKPDWNRTMARQNRSGTELGKAYHSLLEHAAFESFTSPALLKKELELLAAKGVLGDGSVEEIETDKIAAFWNSEIGLSILEKSEFIHRELPFTAKFAASDLRLFSPDPNSLDGLCDDDFVVVQGAVDLAVITAESIWIVDFKSDYVQPGAEEEKAAKYEPQLRLYARALQKVYGLPIARIWLHFIRTGRTFDYSEPAQEIAPVHQSGK
jgi:ATP-dependent helicase/nuclease subunit A